MEKMRMETSDLSSANVEKIGALFPNCITDTRDENGKLKKAINFDLLRQMLSEDVVDGDEAYEFTWVGKKAATKPWQDSDISQPNIAILPTVMRIIMAVFLFIITHHLSREEERK